MDHLILIKIAATIITSTLLALFGYLFKQYTRRVRAADYSEESGRIRLNLWQALLLPVLVFCLGAALIHFSQTGGEPRLVWLGMSFVLIGLAGVSFSLPVYDIHWDEYGFTGPSSWLPWPIGPRPVRIEYADIIIFGTDWQGGWFVEDLAGQRIRWNDSYLGFPALGDAIFKARPDLYS